MPRPAVVLAAALVLALAGVLAAFPRLAADPHGDFVEYWAAGRIALAGGNPYDPAAMLDVERAAGWELPYPMMMLNPPWTLPLVTPLGALPFPLARGLWLCVQLAVALGCAVALWRAYRGPAAGEPVAVVVAALFVPLWLSLKYGQIGPLVLLGLTGFLTAQAVRRDLLAGAFLALAAVKPHLVYLVWPAVLAWAVVERRGRVVAGGLAAGLALAALPLAVAPDVYADFYRLNAHPPAVGENYRDLRQWDSPTLGWQLRRAFGAERFWLQWVPPLAGLGWLAWYGWRHRRGWDWTDRLPVLLAVSVWTAAYGAWPADSLVLLPAVIAGAVAVRGDPRRARVAAAGFATLGLLSLAIERGPTTEPYVWVPPLYLGLYLWARRPA